MSAAPAGPQAESGRFVRFRAEVAQFLIAGGLAYAVDVLVFNLCLVAGLDSVTSKIVSSVPATIVAYIGNRYWTYRNRERTGVTREYTKFFVFSAVAAGIQAGCVYVSHDVLGFTGALADNISGNIVGMALGTLFRFWAFRTFVFKHKNPEATSTVDPAMSGAGGVS